MITDKRISFVRLFRLIWVELLGILIVASLPVIFLIYFDLAEYAINVSIPVVIGTALAIFLGFRTNSAYERWWEARKIWGGIITDSRNLVRQCQQTFGSLTPDRDDLSADEQSQVREICYRQIAWARILNSRLKGLPYEQNLDELLDASDASMVHRSHDPVLGLLSKQGQSIRRQLQRGGVDSHQFVLLQETINRLTDHYGGCQRLKGTVFPTHYSFFTRVFIWIFIALLAASLPSHDHANHYTLIPAIFVIGWVFFMIEGIGSYMQDPFENNRNVIPMDALATTIERDLREAIGETNLPPPVQPVDGALY